MKENKDILQEIEKTLGSIDGVSRAAANPFLYTRIRAKLDKQQNIWAKTIGFITRPAFAVLIIVLVLSANVVTLYSSRTPSQSSASQAANTSSDLPAEYDLAVNTFYDYETP